ncbi:MAG: hypothetical protein NC397_09355 [Clostridium sp.]|nr:hypothetical protein [Clostridium sp.]
MKNKYKVPKDVYNTVKQYIAGYDRRKASVNIAKAAGLESNQTILEDIQKNKSIDNAANKIGLHIQDIELREKLRYAIKENCINKNASFEYFDLTGISSYYFYQEKHKFIYRIAKDCYLIN